MSTQNFSERDVCSKFITPALQRAGWDLQTQIREEVTFTAGRIMVRGKKILRGQKKRADYVLYYKNHFPIAVIEAKDGNHTLGDGMQQALQYGEALDVPFLYSSNGSGFLEHDRMSKHGAVEQELALSQFPGPDELLARYMQSKDIVSESRPLITQDYHQDGSGKEPRYFQEVAINRTVEAIAKGKDKILLVMATGTGKTYTAFQIIWRLWKAGRKKRILFLVDRNVLADQAITNDFKHFGDKMTKITNRQIDKAYEVYLALYQGVSGIEADKDIYKQFSPDFFDLIIIDECHRGSARENSAWRDILNYYHSATQIGLTATPKETKDISNIDYFGEPVYTYSLKQGIEDGFLAPYKVIRYTLDKDIEYRPVKGTTDKLGREVPDRVYNRKDIDRTIILDDRTKLVAQKVSEFLRETDPYSKTIVFCRDIDHAERMRQALVNAGADLVRENSKYIVRITGDSPEGIAELDNFIDPGSRYPVIATTSKLLTTGVDTQTVKLIVLDTEINSITEFKQIIGRGTRIREDYGKYFFTIMDFRAATEHFADPEFDGEPVQILERAQNDPPTPSRPIAADHNDPEEIDTVIYDPATDSGEMVEDGGPPQKYHIQGVDVNIINKRVQYYGPDGKLITESLEDFTKKKVATEYASLNDFLQKWNSADKKKAIIRELIEQGVLLNELEDEVGKDLDPFDLVCHIAYGRPPLTRRERAENVKKRDYFEKYEGKAKEVLSALLEKYADEGIVSIEDIQILNVRPFTEFGTAYEIVHNIFGSREKYVTAVKELERQIYQSV